MVTFPHSKGTSKGSWNGYGSSHVNNRDRDGTRDYGDRDREHDRGYDDRGRHSSRRGERRGDGNSSGRRGRSRSHSASSSMDPLEKKVQKARKCLLKHDQDYANYVKAKEAEAEKAKIVAQGRILAEALQPALASAMSGFAQPAVPQAAQPPFPPPHPGAGGTQSMQSAPAGELSAVKRYWLQAELDHTIESKTYVSLETELSKLVAKKKLSKAMSEFLAKHSATEITSKKPEDKVAAVIRVLKAN